MPKKILYFTALLCVFLFSFNISYAFECLKAIPENAVICPGDNENLTKNVNNTVVKECTDKTKCQFICDEGYAKNGNKQQCIPACKTTPMNATMCDRDDIGIFKAINGTVSTNGCTDSRKCEFVCNAGYIKSGNNCVPDQCPDNLTPEMQQSDPACWTSYTTTKTVTCTWSHWGWDCCKKDGSSCAYKESCGSDEVPRIGYGHQIKVYKNSCGGTSCNNPYTTKPDDYTKEVDSTAYKCHYTVVNEWETCDATTGIQSAIDVTQKITNGKNCSNLHQETTRFCGICGPKNGIGSYDQPEDPGLCTFGMPVSGPQLHPTEDKWIWTCEGGDATTDEDDDLCEAPRSEPGRCSSSLNGHAFESQLEFDNAKNNGLLCDSGVVEHVQGGPDTGWTWDCIHFGEEENITERPLNESCASPCFDYSLNIDKNQFYWTEQDNVDVTVEVEKIGACKDQYSCTVTVEGEDFTDETFTKTIDAREGVSSYDISGTCSRESYDDEERAETINGNCIARSCTPNGMCQGMPQSASSSSSCTSTCSSNADCTVGRMIETRP